MKEIRTKETTAKMKIMTRPHLIMIKRIKKKATRIQTKVMARLTHKTKKRIKA